MSTSGTESKLPAWLGNLRRGCLTSGLPEGLHANMKLRLLALLSCIALMAASARAQGVAESFLVDIWDVERGVAKRHCHGSDAGAGWLPLAQHAQWVGAI